MSVFYPSSLAVLCALADLRLQTSEFLDLFADADAEVFRVMPVAVDEDRVAYFDFHHDDQRLCTVVEKVCVCICGVCVVCVGDWGGVGGFPLFSFVSMCLVVAWSRRCPTTWSKTQRIRVIQACGCPCSTADAFDGPGHDRHDGRPI